MRSIANIKSISYLKSHAAQISEDLEMNGNPFVITQNGEASMVIEGEAFSDMVDVAQIEVLRRRMLPSTGNDHEGRKP